METTTLHNQLQVVNTGESYVFGNLDTIKNGFIFVLEHFDSIGRLVLVSRKNLAVYELLIEDGYLEVTKALPVVDLIYREFTRSDVDTMLETAYFLTPSFMSAGMQQLDKQSEVRQWILDQFREAAQYIA